MDRDTLAQILMLAAGRGSNPMGGPRPYAYQIPNAPEERRLPSPWMPPDMQIQPTVPQGPSWAPDMPMRLGPAPLNYRRGAPTGASWRDIVT
jgi:hypothetical protein